MKECPRCHQILPESSFHRDKSKKDGLSSYCKQCKKEHNKQYRKARLENNQCYDCGTPLPFYWNHKRFCPDCYEKRLKMNKKYEKKRVEKGFCRQCGKNPTIIQGLVYNAVSASKRGIKRKK